MESSGSANTEIKTGATEPSGSAHQAGFQDEARTRKKARLQDVEDSQRPAGLQIWRARLQEAWGVPLTETAMNKMNEAIAKQDELRRAKRKNTIKQDE